MEEPAPPCGESLSTAGRPALWQGARGRWTWPWPRDGHRLVYSQGTVDWDIWRLDLRRGRATGEAQTRFAPSTETDANPQFSPDGERVAFTSVRSGQTRSGSSTGKAGTRCQLTSLGRRDPSVARGGPRTERGSRSTLAAKGGINVDIYVISASGGTPQQVTTSPAIDSMASWSRDGRFIYFGSHRDGSGGRCGRCRRAGRNRGAPGKSLGGRVRSDRVDRRTRVLHEENVGHAGSAERPLEDPGRGRGRGGRRRGVPLLARQLGPDGRRASTSSTRSPPPRERAGSSASRASIRATRPRWHDSGIAPFLGGPAISVSADGRWMLSTQSEGESDLMLVETFR